ncbi:MAG: radical SAM protein [Deltaproteobacteria bacterium]|nr:radical SAM protein [Deltaproteobacteria bacterium]
MKIILLNPPGHRPGGDSLVVPPLGLAYLAAVLRQEGFAVSLKDAFAERLSWDDLAAYLKAEAPDILGLSSVTHTIASAFKAVQLARPHVSTIVMGGPHISVYGQEIFQQCPELDLGVVGEGEETITELVTALAAGRSPEGIPGVIGKDFIGPQRPLISNLDQLPFPARDLLPLNNYHYALSKGRRVMTLFTSRGCPYHCIFCDKSIFGSRWRARSAQNILAEIDELVQRFKTYSLIIYDDLFTLNTDRVTEICEGILQRGYRLDWKCESRVNLVDQSSLATLKLMKRAGCSLIAYGVESGNQHALDYLNKKITVEQIRRAFALTHQAGLETMAYFILGLPVESYADGLRTIAFAQEIDPTYVQFATLSPFYGTTLHREAQEKGWYQEIDTPGPLDKGPKRPVLLAPQWDQGNLQKIVRRAHLSFYLRPRYVLKRLLTINSFPQFVNSVRGFLDLARWLTR